MTGQPLVPARGNQLLDRLPKAEYQRLLPLLKPVKLALEQVLYQVRGSIDYAYFPIRAVTSALTIMQDGTGIEVATIGNEGLVGHTAAFGIGRTSPNKLIVQIGDGGLRIDARALRDGSRTRGARCWILTAVRPTSRSWPQVSAQSGGMQWVASPGATLLSVAVDDAGPGRVPTICG